MEGYRPAHIAQFRQSRLTKLYSDAKKNALTSLQVQSNNNAQYAPMHRKFRIQKDRLVTWGLEWSDGEKGADGDIDEEVAKAGLTETVTSVMHNIQEVLIEAESIKSASLPLKKAGELITAEPAPFDEARYEDLLKDLTTSIDTLYDLTMSRRAIARGEHPKFEDPMTEEAAAAVEASSSNVKQMSIPRTALNEKKRMYEPSIASSETTLVNPPPFERPVLSPYAGLPARIEVSALQIPNEGPPPYEAIGVPSTTRMVAFLLRHRAPESVQQATGSPAPEVPVLIEYANYDTTYRETGVPPPLQRLEALAQFLQPMRAESQTNLSLLGYFEDVHQPRIGLVYDLPYSVLNKVHAQRAPQALTPLSLLKLVQKSNRAQSQAPDAPPPALEHRFRMSLRLAEQLHSLHASRIAHGNINSSSIIFTTNTNDSEAARLDHIRSPLWASFDVFSKCTVEGVRREPAFNIYRHPQDESNRDSRGFPVDLKFDLYGLGLVLLEIGLWTPIGELYKSKYTIPDFKLRLEKLWIPKLGAKCGSAYQRAVETCLRLSDDPDSSMLTVEGIYGILLQFLKRCCLLDDVGSSTELIPVSELMSAPNSPAMTMSSAPSKRRRRRISEASSSTRAQTDPIEHAATLSQAPQRHYTAPAPSHPALARLSSAGVASNSGLAVSRQPSRASQLSPAPSINEVRTQILGSGSQIKEDFQFTASSTSFKDFKRRVTLIQQKWRECQAFKEKKRTQQYVQHLQQRRSIEGLRERRSRPKRYEFSTVPVPPEAWAYFQEHIASQVIILMQKTLPIKESSSINLVSYGETPDTTKPTVIVTCEKCASLAKAKHILKRHLKVDKNVLDIRVKQDIVRRCRRSRRDRASNASRTMASWRDPDVAKAVNGEYQQQPVCGASIGSYRYDEHLPPASFGGLIVVDGTTYGMSVHHMLEPEDAIDDEHDEDAEEGADDESDTSSLGGSDDGGLSDEDDLSTVRPASTVDDEPLALNDTGGDCPGITPGDMEEVAITQPALDDAIDCDLHAEEDEDDEDSGIDEDHLLSFKLGQVHASSGLRRTAKSHEGGFKSVSQSLPQEIDWALFELLPPRTHPYNLITGGQKFCSANADRKGNSLPSALQPSSHLACKTVHCLGRTSGLGHGTVSANMVPVKIHGRSTYSASWTIAGTFGTGGDSGAWVIDSSDGKVCGHVLASRTGQTYICPMDLLLEDIRQTLGAVEVTLPVMSRPSSSSSERKAMLADAINRMRIGEAEAGGVPIPAKTRAREVESVG
ncbi:hypothetical protein DOTSEDRAFT_71026 [Dothistroma septosporum NZE10]|uniref:Protein kinase domain-containing protein n=1 Tax=Dothistroma septosporum (strain NZE10 / CBS 128990) TaxID=675120 RepID=N1PS36_DOTSN|nr:hypothetical protein DOTSEDRAFT_71026 [Dothistroma septosporum NZE10]